MTRTLRTLIAGAALLSPTFAGTIRAEILYPRTIGSGENTEIDYGPGPRGNVFGGGRMIVSGSGEDVQVRYLDPGFAQAPRPDLMPHSVGSGEGSSVIYLPAGTSAARLALIGADGSLPAETPQGAGLPASLAGRR